MIAYKITMAVCAFAFFGCVGMLIFGYVSALAEALKIINGKIDK